MEASSAVERLEESEFCTAAAVVEAGTVRVAVMRTLAAATLIATSDLSMPAAVAVPRVEESEVCTAAAVVEAGTAMVAVMITLAAATAMVTSDLSTPAAVAMPCRKLEVSE